MNEKRLLQLFRERDRGAFDVLFVRHGSAVRAFARRLTGNCADAEDLTQETFLAAYKSAERFGGRARLSTYLISIALRRWRDRQRTPRPETLSLLDEHASTGPHPKDAPTENQALAGIAYRAALAQLDAPLREAFLLVVAEGLTHKEAAQVLEIPLGTLKWRSAEAVRRLRTALTEEPLP